MRSSKIDAAIRPLQEAEIALPLFAHFSRRQKVTLCLRRIDGDWRETPAPSVEDWNESDYTFLIQCLRNTEHAGGAGFGAFLNGQLKGFASVEGRPFGSGGQYRELPSLHVSEELRHAGLGRKLFLYVKVWAKAQGAEKLYISSHPAVESQAFYAAMGCTDAPETDAERARREPFDRPLECHV